MARTLSAFQAACPCPRESPCESTCESKRATRPRDAIVLRRGPRLVLRVVMVMVHGVAAMMVMAGREHRAGKHQQKQGCCKNLFHATNVARSARREKRVSHSVSRREREGEPVPKRNSRQTIPAWNHLEGVCGVDWPARMNACFNPGSKTGRNSGNAGAAM